MVRFYQPFEEKGGITFLFHSTLIIVEFLKFPREVSLNFVKHEHVCMKNDAVAFWQTISVLNGMAFLRHARVISDGV